jgi:tRNA U34 5-methylaminomethyl-2-thiouridine-forming methyltransferase MnmC
MLMAASVETRVRRSATACGCRGSTSRSLDGGLWLMPSETEQPSLVTRVAAAPSSSNKGRHRKRTMSAGGVCSSIRASRAGEAAATTSCHPTRVRS